MAFKQADRVQETTVTTGTGSLTLAGAVTGCQSFASGLGATSGTCWYTIGTIGQSQWEVGLGTLSSSSTLARTTILASSNSGSVVDLAAGTKAVFMDIPAAVLDFLNQAEITVASASTCDIGAVYGGRIGISGTTTITSFGTAANKLRVVRFAGALTLTHNGTSLILPGAANIAINAGDTAIFGSDGSGNWRCYDFTRGDRRTVGADGTVALPAFSFEADPDSGVYRIGANNVGIAVNGVKAVDVGTASVSIVPTLSTGAGISTLQSATVGPTLSTTSQTTFTVASAGHTELMANLFAGLIIAHDDTTGESGIYLATTASGIIMISGGVSSTWVAPTTTPAASKNSIANDGTWWAVYNGYGVTHTYRAMIFQLR